jgi:hypothetical protein
MKLLIPAVVLYGAVSVVFAQSLAPSPMETWKQAEKERKEDQLYSRCNATAMSIDRFLVGQGFHPEMEHFHVIVSKTAGQVAIFFAEAKRLYRTVSPDDVPEPLRTDAVFVNADPHQPSSGSAPGAIEHIVLISKKSGFAVQPLEFKAEPVEWGSAAGGKMPPNRATARFELSQVRELPAGEFDVVLVTEGGERRCKVGAKDRERLFGGR